jgi:hypothetical protein
MRLPYVPQAPRRISLTPFNVSDLCPAPESHKFDSLDYEVVENTVYRANQANSSHLETVATGAAKWTMCFFMGERCAALPACLPTCLPTCQHWPRVGALLWQ